VGRSVYHPAVHTEKYFKAVNEMLAGAYKIGGRTKVQETLLRIRLMLEGGTKFW
jgi:hypothetical protein